MLLNSPKHNSFERKKTSKSFLFGQSVCDRVDSDWGTGTRGLMRGMANLPRGNQELLVVKDKVGRPPGELGVSTSMGLTFSIQCFDTVGWVTGRASGL